eukprot:SAG22_NODE_2542_length_2462_cov_4.573424_2_plen_100_part_00
MAPMRITCALRAGDCAAKAAAQAAALLMLAAAVLLPPPAVLALDNNTTRTPNMGMLNWGVFRCETDCATHRDTCVSEENLKGQMDAMVRGGYVKAGCAS